MGRRYLPLGKFAAFALLLAIPFVVEAAEMETSQEFLNDPTTTSSEVSQPADLSQIEELDEPRQGEDRRGPFDPFTTLIAIPEYKNRDGFTSRLRLINGTIEHMDILAVARDPEIGAIVGRAEVELWDRGTFREGESSLFEPFAHSAGKADLQISGENFDSSFYYGKFTSTLRLTGPSGRTESAFSFNSVQQPLRSLSIPYRPLDASMTEIVVSNEATVAIDVYLRGPDGQEFLLDDTLGPHRQFRFDFAGLEDFTHGDILAYQAGTTTSFDALVGTMKFAYEDDYGRAEGYALRGEHTDGSSEFSSEFFVPVGVIEQMSELGPVDVGSEFFVYRNVGEEEQTIAVSHFLPDGALAGSAEFTVGPGAQAVGSTVGLGFDRTAGGMLHLQVSDGEGDMVYFATDVPDDQIGSSILAGGRAPSHRDISKYLRFGLTNAGDVRQVFVIHNPHDEETILDFGAFSRLGTAIQHNLPDNLTIPARATVTYNSQDVVAEGFDASSILGADNGLVGVVLNYSVTPVKDLLSASGVVLEAVNEPESEYVFERIDVDGQVDPDTASAFLGRLTGFIVDYRAIAATLRVDRVDMLVDGIKVAEYDEPTGMFIGQVGFNYEFLEHGAYEVTFRGYAADDNVHFDFSRSIGVDVLEHIAIAELTYFDIDHQPTDTLKVNEPFYVQYRVERFDDGDIGEIFVKISPSDGLTDDDFRLFDLSGTLVEGESYRESGVGVGQSDVNGLVTLEILPEVKVFGSGGGISPAGVEGSYLLPPERVYDDIPDYRELTEQNVDGLAEVLSRDGVTIGGTTTQLSFDQAKAGLQDLVDDPTFSGVEINDYQNRSYFPTDISFNWFDLGGQSFFAEQNIDDLKAIFQVD